VRLPAGTSCIVDGPGDPGDREGIAWSGARRGEESDPEPSRFSVGAPEPEILGRGGGRRGVSPEAGKAFPVIGRKALRKKSRPRKEVSRVESRHSRRPVRDPEERQVCVPQREEKRRNPGKEGLDQLGSQTR
jgi:hypothetical protein